ncbi:MAG: hypothetical protein O3C40_11990 [Planctomycetota bacterium]|nr:hypothetical protein [Planctomycetota bacterium]
MARRKQALERSRRKKLERREQRDRKPSGLAPIAKMTRKMAERLDDAHDLIHRRDYAEAEELLRRLDDRGTSYPQIVEALMFLYQETRDHASCCAAAKRLTVLQPRDPEALVMYAQESMFCGHATIARLTYERFIERWPEHEHVPKAKHALEILVPETEERIKNFGFPKNDALEWLALHEESLGLLQSGDYLDCAAKCRELLAKVPTFTSARNNLAIAYFQCGRALDAVKVVEETRELNPDNRFAEATLAKLYFLTGRTADGQQIADQIVADPPTYQDSLVAAMEALALLGRDEDIVTLVEGTTDDQIVDDDARAIQHHYLAYAKCRLGDEKVAKTLWKKCLKLYPQLPEARENLLDLESGEGHAPWASSFVKWIPKETMDDVVQYVSDEKQVLLARYPAIAALVPALLDRGDPLGREVALRLAKADGSPPMLDALTKFALGTRGPDALRFEALTFLKEKDAVDAGPHRVFSRGKWTNIQLLAAEISSEPRDSASSPKVLELMRDGALATQACDYDFAEACFREALEEEPDNCGAAYNLCTVWLHRDGDEGQQRARRQLEQLHREFPDYVFATVALAQFAGMGGEFQRARDLLAPIYQAKQLHISEAMALFIAGAQIALEERDLERAERAYELLRQFADEDDVNMQALRRRIDKASQKGGLRGLFSRF